MRSRIRRSGVTFDCDKCGKLLRDCAEHNAPIPRRCPLCQGDVKRVGIGDSQVGFAVWLRCLACKELLMARRGEIVPTKPRTGFREFA